MNSKTADEIILFLFSLFYFYKYFQSIFFNFLLFSMPMAKNQRNDNVVVLRGISLWAKSQYRFNTVLRILIQCEAINYCKC